MKSTGLEHPADVIGRLLVRTYEIHGRVLARGGGGIEGIRDAEMLHAAVARPFATSPAYCQAEVSPDSKPSLKMRLLITASPVTTRAKGWGPSGTFTASTLTA